MNNVFVYCEVEVKNIVFQAKESKTLTSSDEDIDGLMKELLNESIIG